MPSGMDWRSPHNPYALAEWSRSKKTPPPWAKPKGAARKVTQLRARQHLSTAWQRFDKRFLQYKHEAILFGDATGDGPTADTVYRLGLTQRDLHKLKDHFDLIDGDGSGEVDYGEFLHIIKEYRSAYTDALFRAVDDDGSGSVSFAEFIQMLGTFCVHDEDEMLLFVMRMFDLNAEGSIDEEEYLLLRHSVKPKTRKRIPKKWADVVARFDADGDGALNLAEFGTFCAAFPGLMKPALRLQLKLRKVTLGERRWRAILRDVAGMSRLKGYMEAHDGALPPVLEARGFVNKLRALVCAREDPNIRYRILLSKQRWRDRGVEEKKAFIIADKASIQYANAAPPPTSLEQAQHMDDDTKHDPYALIDNDSDDSDFEDPNAAGAGSFSTQRVARDFQHDDDARLVTRQERAAYEGANVGLQ